MIERGLNLPDLTWGSLSCALIRDLLKKATLMPKTPYPLFIADASAVSMLPGKRGLLLFSKKVEYLDLTVNR